MRRCSNTRTYRRVRVASRARTQLHDRIVALLHEHEVHCETIDLVVKGADVTLRGRVADPLTRLLVEDLVCTEPSVRACNNYLLVGAV
jgi:hypothetical protein